jgi:hypothetical protein
VVLRNRIKDHRRVRAGDLIPHELNPRTHTDTQRAALQALYEEIGYARSVLAYEVRCEVCKALDPDKFTCSHCRDGYRLKLIDGHLRKETLDPEAEIDVEVLDVDDQEARALLLAIDPLAQLAGYDAQAVEELRGTVERDSEAVRGIWAAIDQAQAETQAVLDGAKAKGKGKADEPAVISQYLVLIECTDERDQVEKLLELKRKGWSCTAKMS